MVAQPSPPLLNVEDYLALDNASDEKHEYVDGRLYAMAGGTNAHDRIGNNVRALINIHLGAGPCALHGPDVRLRVGPTVYYYPDAFVTCDEAVAARATELTVARLVVEVLSDSTEAADRGEKFINYQTLAVFEEYLLVDGAVASSSTFGAPTTKTGSTTATAPTIPSRSTRSVWMCRLPLCTSPRDCDSTKTVGASPNSTLEATLRMPRSS